MNDELQRLYEADVSEHGQGNSYGTPEYFAMRERDRQRRQRIREIMTADQLQVAADYFHAALIFQHGDTPDDAWNAYQLALRATELGEGQARWLTAAAYDRWLMYQGKPQKYGTQFVPDGHRERLWDVDPTTTDAERAAWNVPSMADQLRRAEELSRAHPPTPIDEAPQWLKDAIGRWHAAEEG